MTAATLVIPVLSQRSEYLNVCLGSAVNQSGPVEILVVVSERTPPDNLELIRGYQASYPILRILKECRPSFAAAINTGIASASAERLGILLSDDWLEPQAVEACLDRNADIVSTSMAIFDETGKQIPTLVRRKNKEEFRRLTSFEDQAGYLTHFFLFRREALVGIGGVDETIGNVGPEDFDMIWTLLEKGASVEIVEDILYCYRDHPYSRLTLRSAPAMMADFEKILTKHGIAEGTRRQHLLETHSRWFGQTLQAVAAKARRPRARGWRRLFPKRQSSSVAGP